MTTIRLPGQLNRCNGLPVASYNDVLLIEGAGGTQSKDAEVLISGRKRDMTQQMAKELKRRSAIEPVIGHMKTDGKLGRNSCWVSWVTKSTPCSVA
jgi:hypothetical protein